MRNWIFGKEKQMISMEELFKIASENKISLYRLGRAAFGKANARMIYSRTNPTVATIKKVESALFRLLQKNGK